MTVSAETKRRFALATALRGALMLLAGLYAIIWPTEALSSGKNRNTSPSRI